MKIRKARIRAALIALSLSVAGVVGIATPAHAALTYLYAGGRQDIVSSGVAANFTVANPTLAAGDFHSLVEATVSTANQQQAVEVGWTVDPTTYGDTKTRLFVTKWVNGIFGGYSDAAWVDNASNPVNRGADLTADIGGSSKAFGILHSGTDWWVYYKSVNIGRFPDSAWGGTFTAGARNQVFGEVAANVANPTTQMGNGICPTTTLGATIGSTTNQGVTPNAASLTTFATNTAKYDVVALSGQTLKYGGDGSCP
jgi:hypothetical protein